MKIGTPDSRYSGNNANVTKGRDWGKDVNSGLEMQATTTATYAYSGRIALWDLGTYNKTNIVLPTATNFLETTYETGGTDTLGNTVAFTIGGDATQCDAKAALVAILEGVDESHNSLITTYDQKPVTVISLSNIEIELPYHSSYTPGSTDRLCVRVAADAEQGRLTWQAATDGNAVILHNVKITNVDTVRGLVRFIVQ